MYNNDETFLYSTILAKHVHHKLRQWFRAVAAIWLLNH